jgi:hypothetical protein
MDSVNCLFAIGTRHGCTGTHFGEIFILYRTTAVLDGVVTKMELVAFRVKKTRVYSFYIRVSDR